MQSITLRGADKSTAFDPAGFGDLLRRIPPLVARLEASRSRFSPDERAELFEDLDVLATAIDGAENELPDLRRHCRNALDAIWQLMARLAIRSPVAVAAPEEGRAL